MGSNPITRTILEVVMDKEVWKDITGFPPYQVSNLGRVKGQKGFIKPQGNAYGYYQFGVYRPDGSKVTKALHVVICEEFHGPKPFEGAMALHRDDVKSHNTANNIYWGTHQQNMLDKTKHVRGNQNKVDWDQVAEIRKLLASGMSQYKVAAKFGISSSAVWNIANNKTWKVEANG